jgi:hypothetical protein
VLALVDDPARKANGCIFATDRSDLFGDLDKVVPRAVKETKVGHLRACLQPVGNGTAHAIRAVGASPRNGRIERFAEGGPLHLIDRERNRILGRGETPACDFGFQPSFLVGRQGDVHRRTIEISEPAFQSEVGFQERSQSGLHIHRERLKAGLDDFFPDAGCDGKSGDLGRRALRSLSASFMPRGQNRSKNCREPFVALLKRSTMVFAGEYGNRDALNRAELNSLVEDLEFEARDLNSRLHRGRRVSILGRVFGMKMTDLHADDNATSLTSAEWVVPTQITYAAN